MRACLLERVSKYRIIWLGLALALFYWLGGPLLYMLANPGMTFAEAMGFADRPLVIMRAAVGLLILGVGAYTHYWSSKHTTTARALESRLVLESMLAGLSTRLVNVMPEAVESEIVHALEVIGRFARADRSFINLCSADLSAIEKAYEWHVSDVRPLHIEGASLALFSWAMSRLRRNEVVVVPSVAALPPEAATEKTLWEARGIKSLMIVPMISGETQTGILGLGCERAERAWRDEDIQLLRLTSEIICGFLLRARAEERSRRQLVHLNALREIELEITAQLDLKDLLYSVSSRAVELLGGDSGVFCLYRPDLDALEVSVLVGTEQVPVGTVVHRGEGFSGRVWDSGRPMVVNEYARWGARTAILADHPWTAMIGAPVRYGEQFLGTLAVATQRQRSFSPEDVEFLDLLARQAAIAIRNARLMQALNESQERYRAVSELTSEHAFAFSIDEQGGLALRWATESLTQLLGFPLAELDERGGMLTFFHPEDVRSVREKIRELQQGASVELDARFVANAAELRWIHIAARPLWQEGRVVGLIGGARNITAEKQAAELERKQLAQLEALRRMSLEITAELDLRRLLTGIVTYAVELLEVVTGALYLYRPDVDALELAVTVGSGLAPVGTRLHRGEGVSGKVWESGQPLIIADYQHWDGQAKVFDSRPWSTVMDVPVRYGDQFMGVLGVSANAPRAFSGADAKLLGFFAAHAAVAIHNANLVKALRESEERLRMVVDNMPVLFDAFDENGMALFWNKECERVTGYSAQEIVNNPKSLEMLCPDPEYRAAVVRDLSRLGGWYRDWELEVLCKDGKVRTISWSNVSRDYPIPGWWSWGIGVDVTARKRAEVALRESEERFRSAFEQAAVGIAHVAFDGRFIRINQRFCNILGYSQEEMLARTFQEVTHPDDLEADLQHAGRLVRGEVQTYAMEKRYVRRDGSIVWANLTVSLVRAVGKSEPYFISVVEDISERKHAEAALRESETRYRTLVEASPDAIIVTGLDGRIISMNSQTARMHGFASVEQLRSEVENGLELVAQQDRSRALERIPQIMSEGTARLEGMLLRRDGSLFPGEWNTASFLAADGAPMLIHVVRDISERKRAEERLLRYAKRLESLHEIDRAILAAESPEEVAGATLTQIHELLDCQWAGIALFDYAAGQATLLAVKTSPELTPESRAKIEKGAQVPLREIRALDTLRQGLPIICKDTEAETNLPMPGRLLASEGLRSYMVVPLLARSELIGCLLLGANYPHSFDVEGFQIAQEIARSQVIALQQARLHQQLQAEREQLEKLSMRLLEVQEAERRHIARELHDQIGQMLTGLKLILQVSAGSPLQVVREENLRKAQELLDELIADVRELSLDLRPAMLDDLGLLSTLLWHFDRYTAHTGIKVEFVQRRLQQRRFSPEVETVAYRIIQEALTNVARHARVSEARVSLRVEQDSLIVQVKDQGVGFDQRAKSGAQNTGGLAGMRERVNLLGGELIIKSKLGSGTTLTAKLPLK